jgi:nucleoside-diphosphate-sugar epimerase
MTDLKILLTGSNGFIGTFFCSYAIKHALNVRAASRKIKINFSHSSVNFIFLKDLNSSTEWSDALDMVDVVIHLAAHVHVLNDAEVDPLNAFREVNVDATLNLARQAFKAGCKRFIFISSIGVNGAMTFIGKTFSENDPPSPHNAYAISKWEAEQALLNLAFETGLEVTIIRPPLVYGNNAPGNFGKLSRAVQKGWPLPLGAVHNQRSLIALDNLVDFIITCMNHPNAANQTFLVSDGQDLSTTELLKGMAKAAGVPSRLLPIPVWALQTAASVLGKGDVIQRLCGNLQVDISKARNLLGWTPPISVEEGLRRAMKSI